MKLPVNPRALAGKVLTSKGFRDAVLVYFAYCFRFISPLLLYPLLTRRLGVDGFSVYATAYSIALLTSIVVEYGFNLSGTRDVATAADDEQRGQIVARISFAKALLCLPAVAIGFALGATNPVVGGDPMVTLASIAIGCALGLSAFWYCQGMRRIFLAVSLEVSGQVIGLVSTFLLVRHPKDTILALSIQAGAIAITSLAGVFVMLRQYPNRPKPSIGEAVEALVTGFPIFISRSAVVIYGTAGVFVLGLTSTAAHAAWYGAAERVIAPAAALLRPMSTILLPRLSAQASEDPRKAARTAGLICAATGALYLFGALVVCLGAPLLFKLIFGAGFAGGAPVLAVLAFVMPAAALNTIVVNQLMVALRLDKKIAQVVLAGAAVSLASAFLLSHNFGGVGMAASRLVSELFIFGFAAFLSWRHLRADRSAASAAG